MSQTDIVDKAMKLFYQNVKDFGSDPYAQLPHVPEVEKWANYMLKNYPLADREIVMLSVWLHDIGHYPISKEDHAYRSACIALKFLEGEGYPMERISKVLHCVRSHRCQDMMPDSLEAKILAFSDSASHMTDPMYLRIARDGISDATAPNVYEKMERDFRDMKMFPEMMSDISTLFVSWKLLIRTYENVARKLA
jgi:predicted metal-dependent HD superfamily phosphohydrolase